MTRKKIIITVCLLTLSFCLKAQNKDTEQIEQLKIAFFTEKLNLSAKEAVRFWPVYNKHNKRYEELRKNEWSSIKSKLEKIETLSQKEAEVLLDDYLAYKQARVGLREDFVKNLKEVITSKQIMMLKKAEYDFNKKLLKQYQSDKSSNE
jgi:hypothetical protein